MSPMILRSRSGRAMQQQRNDTDENDETDFVGTQSDDALRLALTRQNDPSAVNQSATMMHYPPAESTAGLSVPLTLGDSEAISFFFHTVGSQAASKFPFRGIICELQHLYQKSSSTSQLGVTTLAICQLTYGIATGSPRAILESEGHYGRGLYLTRKALESKVAIKSDGMLLAVLLLGLYEQVSANFPSRDSDMHQLAIPIILGHRGFTQFDQPESRSIFFNLQSQLLHVCLARTQSLRAALGKFSHVVDLDESNFGNRLTGICLIVPELKCEAKEIIQNGDVSADSVDAAKTILYCGVLVDTELQAWQMTNAWVPAYTTIQAASTDWLDPADYPYGVHVYQDLASACVWNLSRIARIQLNVLMLDILEWLGPWRLQRYEEQRRNRYSVLHVMVQDVCASIPYHLGNRQACMSPLAIRYPCVEGETIGKDTFGELLYKAVGTILIPLMTCLLVAALPEEQKTWICGQIKRVRQVMRNTTRDMPVTSESLEEISFLLFSRAVDVSAGAAQARKGSPAARKGKGVQYACLGFKCWPKRFTSFSNLVRHNGERHREGSQGVHQCPICHKTFTRPESIPRHMKDGRCEGAHVEG